MSDVNRPLTPEEIEQIKAETEEVRQRIELDRRRFEGDDEVTRFRINHMHMATRESEISLQAKERQNDVVLADDLYNRYYYFDQAVSDKSVQAALVRLGFWHRTQPNKPITLVFNSPGGDIIAGFALFDYIQELKRQGHDITTHSIGTAASMACVLLQAGTHRTMGKEAMLLIHQGSFGARGSAGEMKDMQKFFDKLLGRIENIFLDRAKEAHAKGTATKVLTKKKLNDSWERTDWWLSSEEALELGIVDEIK